MTSTKIDGQEPSITDMAEPQADYSFKPTPELPAWLTALADKITKLETRLEKHPIALTKDERARLSRRLVSQIGCIDWADLLTPEFGEARASTKLDLQKLFTLATRLHLAKPDRGGRRRRRCAGKNKSAGVPA